MSTGLCQPELHITGEGGGGTNVTKEEDIMSSTRRRRVYELMLKE